MRFQVRAAGGATGLALLLLLAACDGPPPAQTAPRAEIDDPAANGFLVPPTPTGVASQAGGLLLSGAALPGATVRLATPGGEARTALADAAGAWRVALPPAGEVRLFGLSMTKDGRAVQAEGYLAVTPEGQAFLLRSGAGAQAIGVAPGRVALLALDVDAEGGAAVSGVAASNAMVRVSVDGRMQGEGKAGSNGAFSVALTEPAAAGSRVVSVSGVDGEDARTLQLGPPGAIPTPPFAAHRAEGGWRVDWMTPGGGVQSTTLLSHARG